MDRVLYLCILLQLATLTHTQQGKKFFRKDYHYIADTQSFYKIHTISRTWKDAKAMCAAEGATLFYPQDKAEVDAVINFWNETQPFQFVFIGVSAAIVEGVFETIDGIPISDVYSNWAPGEPNNAGGDEACVVLIRNGNLNDDQCENKKTFICKKTLTSLMWNVLCNIPNDDYIYNNVLGKCYKFHLHPKKWTDAYAVCAAEQSYLAVLDTQAEADYVLELARNTSKIHVKGDYFKEAVLLGFHNRNGEGWQTIKGASIDDSGYSKWGNKQPSGGANEACGSILYDGHLNSLSCDQKCLYVCEHDVDLLMTSYDDRFSKN